MKTENSDLLDTSSQDAAASPAHEQDFEYPVCPPSLERCFEQLVVGRDDGITTKLLPNSSQLRRRQIALLLSSIPSAAVLSKLPEVKEAERAEIREYITIAEQQGGFRGLIDLQEECYKRAVAFSVDRTIQQEDAHCQRFSPQERKVTVEGLLAERNILGFRELEQTDFISRRDCIALWAALSQNEDLRNYMTTPSLRLQATESVGLLLKYFIKGEDPEADEGLQRQLLEEIITTKSLQCLDANDKVELSRQNKERLSFWIQQLRVFRRYCEHDDEVLQQTKILFGWSLLKLFSPGQLIIDPTTKYCVIETLMENPNASLEQFNLSPSHFELLKTHLGENSIFAEYCQMLQPTPLSSRKLDDIRSLLTVLQVPPNYQAELQSLLSRYDFAAFYVHPAVRSRLAEVYELINGNKGLQRYAHYHRSRRQQDHDIDECERTLRSELAKKFGSANNGLDQALADIIERGDWSAVQGNPRVSEFTAFELVKVVTSNTNFQLIKKYRHAPQQLKAAAQEEVEAVLIACNVPNFQLASELAHSIIEDRSVFHVRVCEEISDQNKRLIEERLGAPNCQAFGEYLRYFGTDWKLSVYSLQETLLEWRRRNLPSVHPAVLQGLLTAIPNELSFDCVRTDKRLTEADRSALLTFLSTNEVCVSFTRVCSIRRAVDSCADLLKQAENHFSARYPQPKPTELRNLSLLQKAVKDFLLIDDYVLGRVSYNSASMEQLRKDSVFADIIRQLAEGPAFSEYRKHYPFLLDLRSDELLSRMFKKFVLAKGVKENDVGDLYKSFETGSESFRKKLDKLAADNSELLRHVNDIERQCLNWDIYKDFQMLEQAKTMRQEEIKLIRYENFIDGLQFCQEFGRLASDRTIEILKRLKNADLTLLQDEQDTLSRRDKQNICMQIHSSDEYKQHFARKEDEISRKFKDSITSFLPRNCNPLGEMVDLYDLEFITSKAGDRATQLAEKFRLFSGLRITKDQFKLHFRDNFVRTYLFEAEQARKNLVRCLLEEQSTILANVVNGNNRSLPDILHLLFSEGRCDVPELPGLTHMTSKKFEQEYRGRPRFADMKYILEQFAYVDALDTSKPPLCLLDGVRDHTTSLINELGRKNTKEQKPPCAVERENRPSGQVHLHRLEPLIPAIILGDCSNAESARSTKRLTRFVPHPY